jgi:hypothetical protein
MDTIEVVEAEPDRLTLRHNETGHVFTYLIAAGDLMPGGVIEGRGPKDPGDVAADVRAAAKREAQRRGLL